MLQRHDDLLERLYPEFHAGGFTRCDGTIEFFGRVQSLLTDDAVVVDYGAGRGKFLEDGLRYRREVRDLRRPGRHVIGLDIDPVVLGNPAVDEAHAIGLGDPWPVATASVDAIVADWTFEHVRNPAFVAAEASRVLRPGGWLCARTPNKWGVIGVPTRLVPNRLHDDVLRRVQPDKQERDTFPTAYALNSRRDLRRHFPPGRFSDHSYFYDSEPAYAGGLAPVSRAVRLVSTFLPGPVKSTFMVFLRRL